MRLMSPTDAMFLVPESRDQPMHVGSLQLYRRPPQAPDGFLVDAYNELLKADDIAPVFRKRPYRSLRTAGQWTWVDDDEVDLEHHIRHSALPRPGRIRELLALVSRLHSTLLDRHRPLWEMHLIEGFDDGERFAIYTKMHHAMMDGVSGLRLVARSLSTDPDEHGPIAWFSTEANRRRASTARSDRGGRSLLGLPMTAARGVADLVGVGTTAIRVAERALHEQRAAMPLQAPKSILNTGITGARRFAADSWSMERIRGIGQSTGTTINDVLLAMCAGALRTYLLELGELPDAPLIAMTPVSLRHDGSDSGNAVGSILCNLATDIDDPAERLAAVHESMQLGKQTLAGLNQLQAIALSALMMAPALATLASGSVASVMPPAFNLVISNVPGPQVPLYFRGARLEGLYPLSIPTNGQALNITLTSYDGTIDFGLIGCRRNVPHLQRLLTHLEDSLAALEKAVGA